MQLHHVKFLFVKLSTRCADNILEKNGEGDFMLCGISTFYSQYRLLFTQKNCTLTLADHQQVMQ